MPAYAAGVVYNLAINWGWSSAAAYAAAAVAYVGVVAGIGYGASALASELADSDSPGQVLQSNVQADAPRQMIIGERRTAGSVVGRYVYGSGNNKLIEVIALADHRCNGCLSYYANGIEVLTNLQHGVRTPVPDYRSGGNRLWVTWFDGRYDQTAHWYYSSDIWVPLQNQPDWTDAHHGKGVSYAIVEMEWDDDVMLSPVASTFLMQGGLWYDRRKDSTAGGSGTHRHLDPDTWEYTTNVDVVADHYQLGIVPYPDATMYSWGIGLKPWQLPYDDFKAEADITDEQVLMKDGVTYQNRYALNAIFSAKNTHADILTQMARAKAGQIVDRGGRLHILGPQARTPVMTLYDGHLIEGEESDYSDKLSISNLYNTFEGRFPDPESGFQPVDYPRLENATWVEEDGGDELTETVNIDVDTDEERVQRLIWLHAQDRRRQARLTEAYRPIAIKIEEGDWYERVGTRFPDGKVFEAVRIEYTVSKENGFFVVINGKEVDPADVAWNRNNAANLSRPPYYASEVTFTGLVAPIVLAETTNIEGGGVTRPVLRISFSNATDERIRGAIIDVRVLGETESIQVVIDAGVGEDNLVLIDQGILPGVTYEVKARYTGTISPSDYCTPAYVTASETYTVPWDGVNGRPEDLADLDQAAADALAQAQTDISNLETTYGSTASAAASAAAAQAAQSAAETARDNAVTAQGLAETAQSAAETARDLASGYATSSDAAKLASEAAQSAAESARDNAQTYASNASGSATAAAGSATTASTQASNAATSASAAAASVVSATAIARDLFPSDFEQYGKYFTSQTTGAPDDLQDVAHAFVDVSGVGRCLEVDGFDAIYPKGALPAIPGATYESQVIVRIKTDSTITGGTTEFMNAQSWRLLDDQYAGLNYQNGEAPDGYTQSQNPFRAADGWVEFRSRFTIPENPAYAYIRPRVHYGYQSGGNGDGVWQIRKFAVKDVSQVIAAELAADAASSSATAAAASESSAAASQSAAASSASAALASETNASTSAGQASTSASQAATSATDSAGSAATAQLSETAAAASESQAASSASAAAASSSSAATYSANAASSASAALSSEISAEAARDGARATARDLFPPDFQEGGTYFTISGSLPPGDGASIPATYPTVSGIGVVAELTGYSEIYTQGALPAVPGRVYEAAVIVRMTVDSTVTGGSSENFYVNSWTLQNSDYSLYSYNDGYAPDGFQNGFNPLRTSDGWVELRSRFTVPANPSYAYVKPRLVPGYDATNGSGDGTYQIRHYSLKDVTAQAASEAAAIAAASSASTAAASETASSQNASAAQTAKTAAETAQAAAESAESAAAVSETNAAGSASSASGFANNASSAAAAAAGSASSAASSASTSASSASAAAISASAAESSSVSAETARAGAELAAIGVLPARCSDITYFCDAAENFVVETAPSANIVDATHASYGPYIEFANNYNRVMGPRGLVEADPDKIWDVEYKYFVVDDGSSGVSFYHGLYACDAALSTVQSNTQAALNSNVLIADGMQSQTIRVKGSNRSEAADITISSGAAWWRPHLRQNTLGTDGRAGVYAITIREVSALVASESAASAAASSASSAAASETASGASATSSLNSETAANAYASQASTSAGQASTSAADAAASSTIAANEASNSTASASAASSSAASAEASASIASSSELVSASYARSTERASIGNNQYAFTSSETGTPNSVSFAVNQSGFSYVATSDGNAIRCTSGVFEDLLTIGCIRIVPDHTYRMTAELRCIADATNGGGQSSGARFIVLDGSYNKASPAYAAQQNVDLFESTGNLRYVQEWTAPASLAADQYFLRGQIFWNWKGSESLNGDSDVEILELFIEDITDTSDLEASVSQISTAVASAEGSIAALETEVSANAVSASVNAAAISSLDGRVSAYYGISVDSGTSEASLELLAEGGGNPASVAKLKADSFQIDGDVIVEGGVSVTAFMRPYGEGDLTLYGGNWYTLSQFTNVGHGNPLIMTFAAYVRASRASSTNTVGELRMRLKKDGTVVKTWYPFTGLPVADGETSGLGVCSRQYYTTPDDSTSHTYVVEIYGNFSDWTYILNDHSLEVEERAVSASTTFGEKLKSNLAGSVSLTMPEIKG